MKTPLLSIIVIAYDMPRQAFNTLLSFAPDYQQDVDADDYEVVIVENRSARNMDAASIEKLPGNFRYFIREEKGVSPAAAINFAVGVAKGKYIGLLIDGARMVTPGVVRHALMALAVTTTSAKTAQFIGAPQPALTRLAAQSARNGQASGTKRVASATQPAMSMQFPVVAVATSKTAASSGMHPPGTLRFSNSEFLVKLGKVKPTASSFGGAVFLV